MMWHYQVNTNLFPTIALAAHDILAILASSIPCEWLFSSGKQIATDQHSHLGLEWFEELQMMKSAWKDQVINLAALNSQYVADVDLTEFRELLAEDVIAAEWDKEFSAPEDVDLDA